MRSESLTPWLLVLFLAIASCTREAIDRGSSSGSDAQADSSDGELANDGGVDDSAITAFGVFSGVVGPGHESAEHYRLGIARSNNPAATWQIVSDVAPFPPHDQLADQTHINKPSVIMHRNGNELLLYTQETRFSPAAVNILFTRSHDGESWSSLREVITDADSPTALLDRADPSLPYKLWFRRGNDTWLAESANGLDWVERGMVLPAAIPKAAIKVGTEYLLFYLCFDASARMQGCVARAPDPQGPFTSDRMAPVLTREAAAEQSLASDASPGDLTLHVTDASPFYSGQDILVMDSRSQWQYVHVTSSGDYGNYLNISPPLQFAFRVADDAFIASVAAADVYPTSVWRAQDRWHMIATCFKHNKDRTGVAYVELTCAAAGPSLDEMRWTWRGAPPLGGPLSHESALIFPTSAENLSVVINTNEL